MELQMVKMNSNILIRRFSALILFLLVLSCRDMETVVQIELPPVEKQLVVECYLEPGKPYRLLLTETKDFFEDIDACPFVRKAMVVISHGNVKDTLSEAIFFNDNCDVNDAIPYGFLPLFSPDSTRFYNYGSDVICPLDYNETFMIEVWDTLNNRFASATTKMIPPVPIENFLYEFNEDSQAYALLSAMDDASTEDYYRFLLHKGSLTKKQSNGVFTLPIAKRPVFDRVIDDQGIFAGNEVITATNYRFEDQDTLIGTVYHISKEHHDYLESVDDAQSANVSPFAQPASIISNIVGGVGIFAFLSYERDTLYVLQ